MIRDFQGKRRVNVSNRYQESVLEKIDKERIYHVNFEIDSHDPQVEELKEMCTRTIKKHRFSERHGGYDIHITLMAKISRAKIDHLLKTFSGLRLINKEEAK